MKNNYVIFRKTEVSLNTIRQWMKVFLCKTFAVLHVPIVITQESVNMAAIILAICCVIFALLSASKELDSISSFSRGILCCRLLDLKHTSRLVQINWKTLRIVKAVYFCYIKIISTLLCCLSLCTFFPILGDTYLGS